MAVVAMVSIGISSYNFRKSGGNNISRFPIYSIPLRITMCHIIGIDICGGENLFMMSIILFIFYNAKLKGAYL